MHRSMNMEKKKKKPNRNELTEFLTHRRVHSDLERQGSVFLLRQLFPYFWGELIVVFCKRTIMEILHYVLTKIWDCCFSPRKCWNIMLIVLKKRTWFWIRISCLKQKVINKNMLTNDAKSNMNALCCIIIVSGNHWGPEGWQNDVQGSMCKLQYYCFDSTLLKRTLVITEPIISICSDARSKCLHIHTAACLKG